jgi:hypothetical protein
LTADTGETTQYLLFHEMSPTDSFYFMRCRQRAGTADSVVIDGVTARSQAKANQINKEA